MTFLDYLCASTMLQTVLMLAPEDAYPFEEYPRLGDLLLRLDEETISHWQQDQQNISKRRIQIVFRLAGNDPACEAALSLSLTVLLYPEFESLLEAHMGYKITFALAYLLGHGKGFETDFDRAQQLFEMVTRFLHFERNKIPFFHTQLTADARLLGYLCGQDKSDSLLADVAVLMPKDLQMFYTGERYIDSITAALTILKKNNTHDPLLQISGSSGCGKRLYLCHAAQRLGLPFLLVDCQMLFANPIETVWTMIDSIRREALFYDAGICYYHLTADLSPIDTVQKNNDMGRFIHLCVEPLWAAQMIVAVCSAPDVHLLPLVCGVSQMVEINNYDRIERIALWQGFCTKYDIAIDPALYGSKYTLSPKEIEMLLHRLQTGEERLPLPQRVGEICAQILPPPSGSIRKVETQLTMDDIKLPEIQKSKLMSICSHVFYRHQVLDTWKVESVYPYGRNVSALFAGPSGTGKTMAAHVLSSMLSLPLYRIDLSQVVDKYIGETEKRLEEIFRQAEKNNTILFFDEADAVFGKRSEVNDAKDKYANTDVSYILQRIEEYEGIVILATNLKRNIDEAFMRRMRYVVEFLLPDRQIRYEIWKSAFPDEVPKHDIDFEYLARQFELSGGSIKNIVLNALFAAAAQGSPVEMKHILESVRDENIKGGKSMLKQDFAEYGTLF